LDEVSAGKSGDGHAEPAAGAEQPAETEPVAVLADSQPVPRPRRRRAASRPAGPPSATTGTEG